MFWGRICIKWNSCFCFFCFPWFTSKQKVKLEYYKSQIHWNKRNGVQVCNKCKSKILKSHPDVHWFCHVLLIANSIWGYSSSECLSLLQGYVCVCVVGMGENILITSFLSFYFHKFIWFYRLSHSTRDCLFSPSNHTLLNTNSITLFSPSII